MKIALLGYGKMGRLIEQEAEKKGYAITAKGSRTLNAEEIKGADIAIDFSHAACLLEHVELAGKLGKNLVIGTTGWEKSHHEVLCLLEKYKIGALYSPNFSLGVTLFNKIVEDACKLMQPLSQYDVAGLEMHHNAKQDAPSGTAKKLGEIIREHLGLTEPLSFSSVRCGDIPGTHTVVFDSAVDTITLTHQARNREGFALGALTAAKWVLGKKGFYTLDDMLTK